MPPSPQPGAGKPWTIRALLTWTESYFSSHTIDSPRLTAEILLAHSLDIKRLDLYLQHDRPLEKGELTDFKALIKRRINREPVAYITGSRGFWDSDFSVTPGVLIPRPETEILVERGLEFLNAAKAPCRVLELGVGSGAVIVSLAKALPEHSYFAGDISADALSVARKNARDLAGDRISFFRGHWFSCLAPALKFDLILSNPPYVRSADIPGLQAEVAGFEPGLALDGGSDGLDCYRQIIAAAPAHLNPGGELILEAGCDQAQEIQEIAKGVGRYQGVEIIKDLSGLDRVAHLKKPID